MKLIQIVNKAAKVKLDDTVDEWSRRQLLEEISKTYGATAFATGARDFGELTNSADAPDHAADTLDIEINSPGGSVFDGALVHNEILALRARGVYVTATVNTIAASMASVICMAADRVRIVPNGRMMIHDVSLCMAGNADALSKMAKVCDEMSNEIADIYAGKTGKTSAECRSLMKSETWMDAKTCIAEGFADALFDIRQSSPTLQNTSQSHEPMNLLNRLTNPAADEAIAEISALKAQISSAESAHASALADLQGKLDLTQTALQEAATAAADLTAAQASIVTLNGTIATLTADLATAKASASAQATQMVAAAGLIAPLAIEGGQSAGEEKTMTRAEFTALKPVLAMKFIKEGGKIIN